MLAQAASGIDLIEEMVHVRHPARRAVGGNQTWILTSIRKSQGLFTCPAERQTREVARLNRDARKQLY